MNNKTKVGFIILREVKEEIHNMKWITCYQLIRKHYPKNDIIILDSSFDERLVNGIYQSHLVNTKVAQNEYPEAGELAAYHYFYEHRCFDVAVIIDQSVFITKYVDFENVRDMTFFWEFGHEYDIPERETQMLSELDNSVELLAIHNKTEMWKGCYNSLSAVTYKTISMLQDRYNIFNLITKIGDVESREYFDRLLGVLVQSLRIMCTQNKVIQEKSFFGDVFLYNPWITDYHFLKNSACDMPVVQIKEE